MAEDRDDNDGVDADEPAEVTVSSLRPDVPATIRARGRFWYRVVSGVVLLALVLAGTLVWLRPTLPTGALSSLPSARLSDPLMVDATGAGISCMDGAAWSPDSRSVVVAGNATCNDVNVAQDETLVVLDAHTGATRAQTTIQMTAVQRAIPPPDGASWAGTRLVYGQPLWSPDGQRLVVTFEAAAPNTNGTYGGPLHVRDGIVVLDNRLSTMRVFAGLDPAVALISGSTFGPQTIEQWDLSTGTAAAVALPTGLAYAWDAGDRLIASAAVAQTPDAPPPVASTGPVGNPLGGRAFTLWQNGIVQFADGTGCSGTPSAAAPNYYLTFLNTSAWSPDGRSLALFVSAEGRLPIAPPTPAPPTSGPSFSTGCTNFGVASDWPQLPVHDAGMRAALALIDETNPQAMQLAWSPNGRRVAVASGAVTGSAPALTVYDCANGQVRLQLRGADIVPAQTSGPPLVVMAWSPDSTRLLLVAQGSLPLPIIRVLGPTSLGS